MRRRDVLKSLVALPAAAVGKAQVPTPGSVPIRQRTRPTDQRFVAGDIVRVVRSFMPDDLADRHLGQLLEVQGSFYALHGRPPLAPGSIFSTGLITVVLDDATLARDRARYNRECRIYSLRGLPGNESAGGAWFDEDCLELVEAAY